mgnify:CR=1 FL=1
MNLYLHKSDLLLILERSILIVRITVLISSPRCCRKIIPPNLSTVIIYHYLHASGAQGLRILYARPFFSEAYQTFLVLRENTLKSGKSPTSKYLFQYNKRSANSHCAFTFLLSIDLVDKLTVAATSTTLSWSM